MEALKFMSARATFLPFKVDVFNFAAQLSIGMSLSCSPGVSNIVQ